MYCRLCNSHFATKYTYRRHVDKVHKSNPPNDSYDSDGDTTNSEDSSESRKPDIFRDISEDNESNTSETESETSDFWTLLIRDTAQEIYNVRLGHGKPGAVEGITSTKDLVQGKHLSRLIEDLKDNFRNIKDIYDASVNDTLLDLIDKKADKIEDRFDNTSEKIRDEAEDMAWKKYKLLVRKKIEDNLDELNLLVDGTETDDEMDDNTYLAEILPGWNIM